MSSATGHTVTVKMLFVPPILECRIFCGEFFEISQKDKLTEDRKHRDCIPFGFGYKYLLSRRQ